MLRPLMGARRAASPSGEISCKESEPGTLYFYIGQLDISHNENRTFEHVRPVCGPNKMRDSGRGSIIHPTGRPGNQTVTLAGRAAAYKQDKYVRNAS